MFLFIWVHILSKPNLFLLKFNNVQKMQLCELELKPEGNIIKHKNKFVQKNMFFNFKIKEASSLDRINMTEFGQNMFLHL